MKQHEQIHIDLREPLPGWQKWLYTLLSALLLAFFSATVTPMPPVTDGCILVKICLKQKTESIIYPLVRYENLHPHNA